MKIPNPVSFATAAFIVLVSGSPSLAHFGHLGELAAHSHWIGYGALGVSGLLGAAAVLAGKRRRRREEKEPSEETDTSGKTAEDPA